MSAPQTIRSSGLKIVAMSPTGLGVIVPPHPQTAEQIFANHPEVKVAVDGPMFSVCDGESSDYARYQCGTVNYYLHDGARSVHVPGLRRNDGVGVTFSIVDGRLTAARGNAPAAGASVSIQCYPALVENGNVAVGQRTSGPDSEANGRVAIGILRDGRLFFAYARMSLYAFAVALRDAGAVWAGYTDGGGSSSLVQRLANGALEGSDADDPRGRRVPSWLVWSDPPLPGRQTTPSSPFSTPSASSLGVAGLTVGALAVAGWWVTRRR